MRRLYCVAYVILLFDKTINAVTKLSFTLPQSSISNDKIPDQSKQTLVNLVIYLKMVIPPLQTYLAFCAAISRVHIKVDFDESLFDNMIDCSRVRFLFKQKAKRS